MSSVKEKRTEKQKKRKEISIQVNRLIDTKCKPCDVNTMSGLEGCKNCPAFKKLNYLGGELLNLSSQPVKRITGLDSLDFERIEELNKEGFTNKDIAEHLRISTNYFYEKRKKWRAEKEKK